MKAAARTEAIVRYLRAGGSMYEDGAKSLLAEHDADRRAEVLTQIVHRLSSRATLYGDSTTINEVIKDLLNLADEQAGKGTGAGTQPPAGEPTQPADFYQPGHTYRSGRTTFQCDAISTHPSTGQRRAIGWVMENDRADEVGSLGQDNWEFGGWSEAHAGTDTCARCGHLFDPDDVSFDGHARERDTTFCRRCVDQCHESEDAGHRCPVCSQGGEAR